MRPILFGQRVPWNCEWRRLECLWRRSATGGRRWEVRMRKRLLELVGLAAIIIAVIVLLKLVPVSTANAGAADQTQPAARTPWGEPDLQGIWTSNYEVPVQRPAQYANKEFFTDEERAELDRLRAGIVFKDSRP